ncbi:BTB POZ domain-containing KCTD21 [Brachionus plicatilis]|uniref:BTB POZ domain-containing KCTD21 n=1 Tax=Brachionus plicatilis TaxID=10195 RepID=A0A3M7Q165_BRAPC|nr:BTB POZ domain-containing KCTD21 [Brachionus plicatilis]
MASFSLLSFETFVFSLLMFSSELVKSQSHETTGNYIFGGYTEQSWDGNSCYKSDPNAFIFSIDYNLKAKINPSYQGNAIYFIQIFSNFNSHNQNSSITESYGSQSTYLAGSQQFTVSQIEVFSLILSLNEKLLKECKERINYVIVIVVCLEIH